MLIPLTAIRICGPWYLSEGEARPRLRKANLNFGRDKAMKYWEQLETISEKKIMKALNGIELTAEETRTIKWIAGWDDHTIDNIISIIQKAKENA